MRSTVFLVNVIFSQGGEMWKGGMKGKTAVTGLN